MDLKRSTARGSIMMTAITLGIRPISMLLSIILLRLLNPDDFGLVAMAMILVGTANLVTNWGMHNVIVQTKGDVEKISFYAFVIVMLASSLLTVVIALFAEPLSRFLGGGEPLVPVLRWLSLYITIGGLGVVPTALLSRQLKFGVLSLATIPTEIAFAIIAIPLALMGYGVWSLVFGRLLGGFISNLYYWIFSRPRYWLKPKKFNSEILKPMMSFGTRVTGGNILRFFQTQGDTWYVGRFFGTVDIGYYSKAYELTTKISEMMTTGIFGKVLFPSYARIQDDRPRLARAYLKSTNLVLIMIVPISIGLAIIAPLLIKVLLGDQWLPMVPIWQVFSLYGLTRPISSNSSPIFLAVGQPQKNITASLVVIACMVPLIFLLSPTMGITGVALAVAIAYTVTMFFNIYQVNTILPGTARKTFVQALYMLIPGVLMAAGVFLLKQPVISLAGGENWIALVLLIGVGAVIYCTITYFLQRSLIMELYELIISLAGIDRRWPRLVPRHARPIE